jgi:D-alanyl-D-alanine carboxypeptidase/D-alanyl-D-alanine-endopeptidase (penicillin-binding protein 4)
VEAIMRRYSFQGARWGAQVADLGTGEIAYALNSDQLFNPGSSYKVFPGGTAFTALGPDHRFRTRVHRTGPVHRGVLRGDLVLVAGADLLLSGRIRRNGTVALPEPDHSYDRSPGVGPIGGDPLQELRRLAAQVAERGIRRIEGRVLVDARLFRESTEKMANGGVDMTVSPIMVNDNLVDVAVSPGRRAGTPASIRITPQNDYVRIVNRVTTIPAADAASARRLEFGDDIVAADGTRTVTLSGEIPLGSAGLFKVYYVPEPIAFAQALFTRTLRDKGIHATTDLTAAPDPGVRHLDRTKLAEHVSPPLTEELKVMLKVSSNPHTVVWPYVVGAVAGGQPEQAKAAGLRLQHELFQRAGLDPTPPGSDRDLYTPDFFVRFLAHMARQPHFRRYRQMLPILGRDGSLRNTLPESPASGHVFAKTGTSMSVGGPHAGDVRKALAGYVDLPGGRGLVFSAFVEATTTSPAEVESLSEQAGLALGEIAAAAYTTHAGRP